MEENLQGSIYFECDNSIDYFYTLYIYIYYNSTTLRAKKRP